MLELKTPIQYLKGVGPKLAPKLNKLGIKTAKDLVYYFPRAWQDFSQPQPIRGLRLGDTVVIKGRIVSINNNRTPRRRMNIISAIVEDEVGDSIKLVWFNQPFLLNNFHVGEWWIFYGRVEYDWQQKEKTIHSPIYEKKSQILPIYPETTGITSKYLRRLIQNLLTPLSIPDFLPQNIIINENLLNQEDAIKQIHLPSSNHLLNRAKYRLAFNEIFLIVLKMHLAKLEIQNQGAPQVKINKELLVKFTKSLPYQLTNAQRKASWEVIQDMTQLYPMNRLLNGDVGSGKTIVALMAALNCVSNSMQVAWMAPTEILANQHYETTCKLLKDFGIKITLVTSNKVTSNQFDQIPKSEALSTKSETNSNIQITKKLKSQEAMPTGRQANKLVVSSDIVIGTHAIIQEGISFPNLGLVIIDEQHRFGVAQRAKLQSNKLKPNKLTPHFLSMTATPIPRTLALSIYGDLDISVLDEMPIGRKSIITRLVDPTNRDKAYDFIRDQIKSGRQVFVICPFIESNKQSVTSNQLFDVERKSVKAEYEKLSKKVFPDLIIGMLHGRLKPKDKEEIMQKFRDQENDILVSTSVVEVGVDIPNASVMVIEDAERFGLAQLHQFRGRVGRGDYQSYCLLFSSSLSPETNNRLKALVDCNNGFKLAERDLEIRGPGELVGISQSGLPDLKMATLTDIILINKARQFAVEIIKDGLDKFPLLNAKLHEFVSTKHLE